jgi:two-component system, NarL family, sensor kinase
MKRASHTLAILLSFITSVSAQLKIDSLRNTMKEGKSYEEKINAFTEYVKYFQVKNFDSVLDAGNRGLELARKNGDSARVAELKRYIGVASYFKGQFDEAAKNYYEAIAILEKLNDREKLAPAYNDLAKLYRKTRDLDRALENYNKADALFRQLKDTGGISMIFNESGVVFEYKGDYDEAIRRYTASFRLAEATGDSLGISYSLSNIAGVYVIQKKYGEAEKNLLKALSIRQSLKDSFAIALNYSDLGATLNAKGDYAKAIAYLTESNRVAEKLNYPELQSNNYTELSSIASKQGNYEAALNYFQKRTSLRDSLYALDKTKQIEELNTRYETVKKEQTIEQQQNRLARQNFLFLGIGGLALMTGLLIHSRYKRYKLRQETKLKTELLKQQEIAVKAVIEAEENERQRIAKDLHDGVGQMMSAAKMNLSAFESELDMTDGNQKKSFEKIIQLVDESCKEVRSVSHVMMPNALLKNNLPDAIRDFVDKLDKKKLEVHVDTEGLDERIDSNVETVLYRVIQECVNNVIRHSGATTLDISLIRDKDGISITVEDNGKGFDIADKEKFQGIGLKNIITRVEYLKGTVDFDSSPGRGTVVALHVPLKVEG